MLSQKTVRATWWYHHVTATTLLAVARFHGDSEAVKVETAQLLSMIPEWGDVIVGKAGISSREPAEALMKEHTVAAAGFINALASDDKGESEKSLDDLEKNVHRQASFYRSIMTGFPAHEFLALFAEHVASLAEAVIALAEDDAEAYRMAQMKRRINTSRLTAFTEQWL